MNKYLEVENSSTNSQPGGSFEHHRFDLAAYTLNIQLQNIRLVSRLQDIKVPNWFGWGSTCDDSSVYNACTIEGVNHSAPISCANYASVLTSRMAVL